jgi:hypothetical protein
LLGKAQITHLSFNGIQAAQNSILLPTIANSCPNIEYISLLDINIIPDVSCLNDSNVMSKLKTLKFTAYHIDMFPCFDNMQLHKSPRKHVFQPIVRIYSLRQYITIVVVCFVGIFAIMFIVFALFFGIAAWFKLLFLI